MNLLRRWKYLIPSYRRRREREMEEELASLAEIAGRRELGNLTLAAENARAVWGWTWLDGVLADVRYAFRVLAREPGFAAVAVLSLALGIGANAAIFCLIDALLLRSLPVREPDQLVLFDRGNSASYFAFEQIRANSRSVLSGVTATTANSRQLDAGQGAEKGTVLLVSGEYFDVLGVSALLGRTLTLEDDRRAQPALAAVISYRYWQHAYERNPGALGKEVRIEKVPFRIVGIAPPEFFGATVGEAPDVWIPLSNYPSIFPGPSPLDQRNTYFLELLGRLKPGISIPQAVDALTPIVVSIDLQRAGPDSSDEDRKHIQMEKARLDPAAKGVSILRYRFSKPLHTVFSMVAIGLLLACINVMGLQFARSDQRRRELSVRLAIGAKRSRVVRQLREFSAEVRWLVIVGAGEQRVAPLEACRFNRGFHFGQERAA